MTELVRAKTFIHPSAVVEDGAEMGEGVSVGPFCHIARDAKIGDGVEMIGHVTVLGLTSIGSGCLIYPQSTLGASPQNLKHKGGPTKLVIGPNCIIREGVTMHAGSDTDRGETTVGANGHFLAYMHIGHDCVVGDRVTIANATSIGGHCVIGDDVNIGAMSALHQFTRIGRRAYIGAATGVGGDVIPFVIGNGLPAVLRGVNYVGLKRASFSTDEVRTLRQAYDMIFDPATPVRDNVERVAATFPESPAVLEVVDFMRQKPKRYFVGPPRGAGAGGADNAGL